MSELMAASGLVLLVAGGASLRLWLEARNQSWLARHGDEVPDGADLPCQRRAVAYGRARARVAEAAALVDAAALLILSLGGAFALIDGAWSKLGAGPLTTGVGVLASMVLVMAGARAGLDAWKTLIVDRRFAIGRATVALFVVDRLKYWLAAALVLAPVSALALWGLDRAGSWWWVYLWALWASVTLAREWAAPVLLGPLFNRVTRLEPRALRLRLRGLAARCGLPVHDIAVIDASRRSAHGNARVEGLGRRRRVVLSDTLVRLLEADELEAVVAHELGHFACRHAGRYLTIVLAARLAFLALVAGFAGAPWFLGGLGFAPPSMHALVAACAILWLALAPLARPVTAFLLRAWELEADAYAAAWSDGGALARALVKLHDNNAAALVPEPLYAALSLGHPPLARRLAVLGAAPGGG